MGPLITNLLVLRIPGSIPDFPTSYRWCGKTGETGTFLKSPEMGKEGKTGNEAIDVIFIGITRAHHGVWKIGLNNDSNIL